MNEDEFNEFLKKMGHDKIPSPRKVMIELQHTYQRGLLNGFIRGFTAGIVIMGLVYLLVKIL